MSPFVDAWWSWMAAMSWQAGALVGLVALIDRALARTGWAQLRYGLWCLTGLKLLLPPDLSSRWSLATSIGTSIGASIGGGLPAATLGRSTGAEGAVSATGALPWIAFGVWILGAVGWLGLSIVRTRRLGRRHRTGQHGAAARPAHQRIHEAAAWAAHRLAIETPTVRLSGEARSPFVTGLRRPVVVLPSDLATSWSDVELRHALLHELAHLRRRDLWAEALFLLLNALYWFHPLVYVVRRRAHAAREIAADALAARCLGAGASTYRDTLTRMAAGALLERGALAVGLFGSRATTLTRLDALDRESWRAPRARAVAAGLLLTALGVALLPMAPLYSRRGELERALEEAHARFRHIAGEPPGVGSLHYRYAVMQVQAAQSNLERELQNEKEGESR